MPSRAGNAATKGVSRQGTGKGRNGDQVVWRIVGGPGQN
jgi:hypothetical protein